VIFHPDHQEIHLPALAVRAQGVEWHMAPGSQATVKYARERVDFENVRLVSADQSLDVNGTLTLGTATPGGAIQVKASNVDLKQLQTLTLQDRGLTGRLNADASISGTTAAPDVKGTVQVTSGGFQSYHYDSLSANVDYKGARLGIDATLHQSATESVTAKGSVPTSLFTASPSGEHVEATPEDAVDLQVKSSAISLALLQGFTNQITNVTGTLEADVHVTGSGQDPHAEGFVDIKNGAFGIPAAGETFTGLTTRVELKPEAVEVREFQLLDRHGERLRVAGELAVHARQLGDVNVAIESDNFEVLNNELGDVRMQVVEIGKTAEGRPQLVGDVHLDAARIEVDQLLSLFYTPYSEESIGEVVSAERTVEGSGGAEDATKQALAKASASAAPQGAEEKAAQDRNDAPAPSDCSRRSRWMFISSRRITSSCVPTTSGRRTDRHGARRSQRHAWRRSPRSKEPECASHSHRARQYRPRHVRLSGPPIRSRAGRHHSIPGHGRHQSLARYQGDAPDPQHRRRSAHSHHRDPQGAAAYADERPAARRERRSLPDRLQPPRQ
jgi:autotransporter translocation and assembly factor TamB